jgi:hypothetical protein
MDNIDDKRIKWNFKLMPLAKLNPHSKNPRIISDDRLKELQNSFDDIGFAQPININQDGTILSGHARFYQLQKEGVHTVACYVPDRLLTPKQEEVVIIRMNKNIAGEWDFEKLINEFDPTDLLEWGFNENELTQAIILPPIDPDDIPDPTEEDPSKIYCLEIKFSDKLLMQDIYDDLISKGHSVRIK